MDKTKLIKYTGLLFFCLVLLNNYPSFPPKPEVKSEKTEASPQPIPLPTIYQSPNPNITLAKVKNVVDGDTFTLETGEVVRMIGIDTPETVHPSKPVQCYGSQASQKTRELLEGKEIKLEKDISENDKYKRLLRYIYIDDVFINEYLVSEGYAKSSSYPPDIKYQNKFIEAEKIARDQNKGLWNKSICPDIVVTNSKVLPAQTINNSINGEAYKCDCSKTCAKMNCGEAQYQLDKCGCRARDADGDGMACDSQCQ